MGGDYGITSSIPASISALNQYPNLEIALVGVGKDIQKFLQLQCRQYDRNRLHVIHANEIVMMDEQPVFALRNKKNSSMRIAINRVKDNQADACVSAGNTGALMATAKFVLKTLPGIDRPAIVHAIPCLNYKTQTIDSFYMLDLGANVNCSSEQLFQFGIMGSILSENIKKKKRPSVALLNIGTEKIKGLDNVKEAAKMLCNYREINYIGYIEGDNMFSAKADVVVCDGFAGNVALKTSEGITKLIIAIIKGAFKHSISTRIAALVAKPVLNNLKYKLDMDQYNGGSLLGLRGIVIKSHGNASEKAFKTAISEAIKEIKYNIPQKIKSHMKCDVTK